MVGFSLYDQVLHYICLPDWIFQTIRNLVTIKLYSTTLLFHFYHLYMHISQHALYVIYSVSFFLSSRLMKLDDNDNKQNNKEKLKNKKQSSIQQQKQQKFVLLVTVFFLYSHPSHKWYGAFKHSLRKSEEVKQPFIPFLLRQKNCNLTQQLCSESWDMGHRHGDMDIIRDKFVILFGKSWEEKSKMENCNMDKICMNTKIKHFFKSHTIKYIWS